MHSFEIWLWDSFHEEIASILYPLEIGLHYVTYFSTWDTAEKCQKLRLERCLCIGVYLLFGTLGPLHEESRASLLIGHLEQRSIQRGMKPSLHHPATTRWPTDHGDKLSCLRPWELRPNPQIVRNNTCVKPSNFGVVYYTVAYTCYYYSYFSGERKSNAHNSLHLPVSPAGLGSESLMDSMIYSSVVRVWIIFIL